VRGVLTADPQTSFISLTETSYHFISFKQHLEIKAKRTELTDSPVHYFSVLEIACLDAFETHQLVESSASSKAT